MKLLLMEDDAVLSDILLDFMRESWAVDYAYDSKTNLLQQKRRKLK